jgi:hypothetical protein
MPSLKCPYCPRTFSSKSGYTQHVQRCAPEIVSDNESDLITDINDMSLDSEELNRNIEKVKKLMK